MTEIEPYSIRCNLCGDEVELMGITSTNTIGQDSDFFWQTAGVNIIQHLVSTCDNCLYSGYESDFRRHFSDREKKVIRRELDRIREEIKGGSWDSMMREFEIGSWDLTTGEPVQDTVECLRPVASYIILARWMKALGKQDKLNLALADIHLRGSWSARNDFFEADDMLLREMGKQDRQLWALPGADFESVRQSVEREMEKNGGYRVLRGKKRNLESLCQENAVKYFKEALTNKEVEKGEIPITMYLIGELNRRLGHFEEATEYFERAKKNKRFDSNFKRLVDKQKAFAEAGDRDNKSLEGAFSSPSLIYRIKEGVSGLKYGCIEFSMELLQGLALWGYYAHMESEKGRPAGPGIIFYRLFRHLKPAYLESAKEVYQREESSMTPEEWESKQLKMLRSDDAEHLKPGEIIYFENYPSIRINKKLGLEPGKAYVVEYAKTDSSAGEKRVRIKVQGINKLFEYFYFERNK